MIVKKCDCNFSVNIKVPNFKIEFSEHFQKFSKIHKFFKKRKTQRIRILDLWTNPAPRLRRGRSATPLRTPRSVVNEAAAAVLLQTRRWNTASPDRSSSERRFRRRTPPAAERSGVFGAPRNFAATCSPPTQTRAPTAVQYRKRHCAENYNNRHNNFCLKLQSALTRSEQTRTRSWFGNVVARKHNIHILLLPSVL